MKKSYNKAEAFKVNFNANEQVAAACQYDPTETAKYTTPDDVLGVICDEYGGQYGNETMNMCYVLDDGTSPFLASQYSLS